jgi:hypothetical protein
LWPIFLSSAPVDIWWNHISSAMPQSATAILSPEFHSTMSPIEA